MSAVSLAEMLSVTVPAEVELRVQVVGVENKKTKAGKPWVKLKLADGSASLDLAVWGDHPAFEVAQGMQVGECWAFEGEFSKGEFGLESKSWSAFVLEGPDKEAMFAGPAVLREKQDRDWLALGEAVDGLESGSLKTMALLLLGEYEEPFRRAAAARGNHHARRGGLVEHVSLMAQQAVALCGVYRELRKDLLVCGVVFHDAGKMVENQYVKQGFEMPFSFRGEGLGHIVIGIEMARTLWKRLPEETQKADEMLLHALCHLIASHHGTKEWGSPVEPMMAEAIALHFIDNMDAKLEMCRAAMVAPKMIGAGVVEGPRPLPKSLLRLPVPETAATTPAADALANAETSTQS